MKSADASYLVMSFVLLLVAVARVSAAHGDTTQYVTGARVIASGDTILSEDFWPFYSLTNANDSMEVHYVIGKFLKGSSRIWLNSWFSDSLWDDANVSLAPITRTKTFTVVTGDTLSFIRHLIWMPADDANADSADYYYNQDTLDFSVVLHRSDGSHAATVDSIGILRQVPPGFPTVYGTEPIIRLVRYVVPASLNNQSAYLAVCPTARGNRSHGFMRYDHRQVRFEARLQDTAIALLHDYYLGLLKPSLRLREMIEAGELGSLTVSPNPSNGAVSISGLFRAGDVVVVANSRGQEVFVHSYGPSEETVRTLECRLRTAGVYFVMQVRNSSVISNRRVIVE